MTSYTRDEIRFAEAVHRTRAHCEVACELYGVGRAADAALHSVRPIADTFPWLETELRSRPAQLRALMVAVTALSGAMRHRVRPRGARRHLKAVGAACSGAMDAVLGTRAADERFRRAVGVALLRSASASYGDGVPDGNLNAYQTSFALVRAAADLIDDGRVDPPVLQLVDGLRAALPTLEPPPRLVRPEDLVELVERIAAALDPAGVVVTEGPDLTKVETLLDDVVRAYDDGVPALAARLAASLYVRTYDPMRPELQARDPDLEARLAQILGIDLRRAINRSVPAEQVTGVAASARDLLASLAGASSRDDAEFDVATGVQQVAGLGRKRANLD